MRTLKEFKVKYRFHLLIVVLLLLVVGTTSVFGKNTFSLHSAIHGKTKYSSSRETSDKIKIINEHTTQRILVNGIVTDENDSPIPGVNIVVEGTTIGTITDLQGNFTLSVPDNNSVLVFSFIGYTSVSLRVGSQREFVIKLESDIKALEEVVVVGYGVQRKESVVGAISRVEGDDIRLGVQGADLTTSLRGSTPGMISLISTGQPGGTDYSEKYGENAELLIRGKGTWNTATPLVLVDGVERDIVNVDPNEIEQISILKDASATAVFGVKGANGVILILTRRGREGKANITFDSKTTIKTISRLAEGSNPLDSYRAVQIKNYAILNEVAIQPSSWNYIVPQDWVEYYKTQEYPYYFPDINWRKENLKDYTVDQTYNLSLTGGTKFVKYFSTISFLEETDILNVRKMEEAVDPSFNFKRINFRSNLDFDITPTTNFRVGLSGFYFNQRRGLGGDSAWRGVYASSPEVYPIMYPDGTWALDINAETHTNSVYSFAYAGYELYKGTGLLTDFTLKQNLDFFLKGLSIEGKLAYDNSARSKGPNASLSSPLTKYIYPRIVDDPRFRPNLSAEALKELEEEYTIWNVSEVTVDTDGYDWTLAPTSYKSESATLDKAYRSFLYEFRVQYQRQFNKHQVSGLALMSRAEKTTGSVFPSYREDWVGRVTYEFDKRYLFETNAAYNGSEKFAKKYRFGFFPSAALGWIVSNETFFEPLRPVINNLKFRYSDGLVGSDAGIERWLYLGNYIVHPAGSTGSQIWYFGSPYYVGTPYPFRYEGTTANPDIHWETARKIDYGIEAGFFNNKILLNFDYFKEYRRDVFVASTDRILPQYYGADPVAANLGKIDVKGWELETEFRNRTAGGFSYWIKYAFAYAADKIIYKSDPELKPAYQKEAGFPIDQPRSILNQGKYSSINTWNDVYNAVLGVTNVDLLPGDWMRIDYNADGKIDDYDKVPHGYSYRPQYTYAPAAGMSYKNFSASISFYGVYNLAGGLMWRDTGQNMDHLFARIPSFYIIDNAMWSPELGTIGKATEHIGRFGTSSSQGYVDYPRNYLRCETAEIRYNLSSQKYSWIKRLGVSNIRLNFTGNNLFLISDILIDLDKQSKITPEANRRNYPLLRRYNFGIHIEF